MDAIEQIQVGPGKVLVKMWVDEELKKRAETLDKLLINEDQKREQLVKMIQDKVGSKLLVKAELINLGPDLHSKMDYKLGDYIYVFPNTYDADFVLNGVGYYVYSERNILAKVSVPKAKKESKVAKVTNISNGDTGENLIIQC